LRIYLDSSLAVSLYSLDANSAAAATLVERSKDEYVITVFGELEIRNALRLRVFRKEATVREAELSDAAFEQDLREKVFHLRPVPDRAFDRARGLSQAHTKRLGTRSADVLHVAAALELGADILYTFDQQQRKLAKAAGLKTS
jgi:predicted nucleic acid-binding protein